jgi:hypothetical protein
MVTQIENGAHKQQDLALTEKQTDEILHNIKDQAAPH